MTFGTRPFDVRIEWDEKAFTALQDGFARLVKLGENTSPLMASIAEGLLHGVQDRFATEKAPDGTSWAPLAESTKRVKKGKKILTEGGYLGGLIRPAWGRDFAETATAPLPYAQVQQDGGKKTYTIKPKGKKALAWGGGAGAAGEDGGVVVRSVKHPPLKARPYMGLSKADEQMIIDSVDEALGRALSGGSP